MDRIPVTTEASSARALKALRRVAAVRNTDAVDEFLRSDPSFFEALASRLGSMAARYEEIERVELTGGVDQEEGHPFVRVRLLTPASPERAFEIRREIFCSWLRELYTRAPVELRVSVVPT